MTKNNGFKVAALAASIALAMGATSAMAADPAANALPGQGKILVGTPTAAVTGTTAAPVLTITSGAASAINWGADSTTGLNKTGVAGFNVGKDATVTFTGAFPVLNIDSTGNASQIFGKINGTATNVWVANTNGIIVGSSANISGVTTVSLLGNSIAAIFDPTTFATTVTDYQGAGGDVTVQPGATIGSALFVSGGGNVNVDLTNVTSPVTSISSGVHGGTNPLATDNTAATVTVTGTTTSKTITTLASAGTATVSGTLVATNNKVAGALTNNGTLTIGTNNAKGSITNNGTLTLPTANGKLTNNGTVNAVATSTFTDIANSGTITSAGGIAVGGGGNLVNTGTITGAGAVAVTNGHIDNSGSIAGATTVDTKSTDASNTGYTAGGQYYISNTGSIAGANLAINANSGANRTVVTANNSTGSFTNTGTLASAAAANTLTIAAQNNVNLGGTLKAAGSALASGNALGAITLTADAGQNGTGVLTVAAPLFGSAATFDGNQVKLMSNVTSTGAVAITAGAAQTSDYAVRVAAGTTTKGSTVDVDGRIATDLPNTILQGNLSAGTITFGGTQHVGDIISGPAGGLIASGATPTVVFNFTGRLKTAPYLNNANNFRYNYLPISLATGATAPLLLTVNPVAYTTNGTSNGKAGVNLLVNGDVKLTTMGIPGGTPNAGTPASAVTGVTNRPNTHIVLQSTGDITTTAATYWPGYVYLGTIDSDSNGNALPGTLSSTGKIDLTAGDFNNVLPGDVAGASGIHFMSGNALVGAVNVTTNANAWINFPTDLLTQSYTAGLVTTPTFYAGTAGSGLVVNYGKFTVGQTEKLFNTHPVDATK